MFGIDLFSAGVGFAACALICVRWPVIGERINAAAATAIVKFREWNAKRKAPRP